MYAYHLNLTGFSVINLKIVKFFFFFIFIRRVFNTNAFFQQSQNDICFRTLVKVIGLFCKVLYEEHCINIVS